MIDHKCFKLYNWKKGTIKGQYFEQDCPEISDRQICLQINLQKIHSGICLLHCTILVLLPLEAEHQI